MAYGSSASDRLAAVRTAIDKCLTGQSMNREGHGHTMARLSELRELERDLIEEVAQESRGSMSSVGVFTRPT